MGHSKGTSCRTPLAKILDPPLSGTLRSVIEYGLPLPLPLVCCGCGFGVVCLVVGRRLALVGHHVARRLAQLNMQCDAAKRQQQQQQQLQNAVETAAALQTSRDSRAVLADLSLLLCCRTRILRSTPPISSRSVEHPTVQHSGP